MKLYTIFALLVVSGGTTADAGKPLINRQTLHCRHHFKEYHDSDFSSHLGHRCILLDL